MRTLLLLVILLLSPSIAHAGYCLGDDEREGEMKKLEVYAKTGKTSEPLGALILTCTAKWLGESKPAVAEAFRKRSLAACTKIAAFRGTGYWSVVEECQDFLIENQITKVGTTDVVARIMARPASPWDEKRSLRTLASSKDPRAHDHIVAKRRATLAKLGKAKLVGWKADAFQQYALDAIAALELVGVAGDIALLEQLVTYARDAKVAEAAKPVRAALAVR